MQLLETLAALEMAPAALALVGVAAVFCTRPDHPWGQPPAAVRAMRRGLKTAAHRVVQEFARSCLAPGEEFFEEEVLELFPVTASPAHLALGLDYLVGLDLRTSLPRLSCPVALIQGEQDRIVPAAQARFLAQQLPGARLHLLPGAGHLPFWTQAAAFNRILVNLTGRVQSSRCKVQSI
jgi:pimeloyl-[acyl-carrier protein] methyl ester esterase